MKEIDALLAVLQEENAALVRHDFAAAVALLSRKEEAAQAMAKTMAKTMGKTMAKAARTALPGPNARALVGLVDENHRLLERAVAVQRQVVATVARAASGGGQMAMGRYGRTGAALGAGQGQALTSRV